jgi:hypothetical protein
MRPVAPGLEPAAARRARPRAGCHAARILSCIEARPGVSARQVEELTGIEAYTVRKRTADLRRWGYAHSHIGAPGEPDRELRWYVGRSCPRCELVDRYRYKVEWA